jgi:hypothetical protein
MLLSFTDFPTFKEMMLDYRRRKSDKNLGILGITVEKANLKDEMGLNNNFKTDFLYCNNVDDNVNLKK